MRAQKCRDDFQGLLVRQLFVQSQNFQLARELQPVPAFGLDRCASVRCKLLQRGKRALLQLLGRCRAQLFHRIENPAAFPRNLLVARSGNLRLVLFRSARRVNQVRVRIHESRQCHAPAQIQFFSCTRFRELFHFGPRSHRGNHAVVHQHRAVFDQAQVRKGIAPPRATSTQRQQLRCTRDEQGIRQGLRIMPKTRGVAQALARAAIAEWEPRSEYLCYALAACPLNAGKNTSCTNVSNEVGVVFFSDRASSGRM